MDLEDSILQSNLVLYLQFQDNSHELYKFESAFAMAIQVMTIFPVWDSLNWPQDM